MLGLLSVAPVRTVEGLPLRGGRVYLRPPRMRDWAAWSSLRARSRAFLEPWEPRWPEDALSRRAFRRRLRRHAREARDDLGRAFFVFRADDDALLGGITLANIQRGVAMSCSMGYWIGEPYARRGYMTEAVRTLLPYVFEGLGLHRLEAACLPTNAASQALLRRVGFHEEGYARGYLRIDGVWRDHLLFALLAGDVGAVERLRA